MAKRSIDDVPTEILQSILAYVRYSGVLAGFVPCLLSKSETEGYRNSNYLENSRP